MFKLEVVAYNIESALRAQQGGADRIELCADPGEGGTTPSYGTIDVVRQNINVDLYVMLRPRGGDFEYTSYEFHAMKRDLAQAQRLSVDGVVFGILQRGGMLDKKRCTELIQRARPLKVTCHRAFDRTRDPIRALEECIEVGFDRILTSGMAPTAPEGADVLRDLVARAGDRIIIMPGSGVNDTNLANLIDVTGAKEYHSSAVAYRKSTMEYVNPALKAMGSDGSHEFEVRTCDVEKIARMVQIGQSSLSRRSQTSQ